MTKIVDYPKKFQTIIAKTLFHNLPKDQQEFVQSIAEKYFFTFQEVQKTVNTCIDLNMWGEANLISWWKYRDFNEHLENIHIKKQIFDSLEKHIKQLKSNEKTYPADCFSSPQVKKNIPKVLQKSDKRIYGLCPVASDKTICCQLITIDAVENCPYACSYCSVQTFYTDKFIFDDSFSEKLKTIPIDPKRFYHFGSGQSSDSLAWGNRNGILDSLCLFAFDHPNILLELKTKSDKIDFFLKKNIPENVVISWTLNTETIIKNEEHFTAPLEKRLNAAREVANKNIRVAFHFHPLVYYKGWKEEYTHVVQKLLNMFTPDEISFLTFGSVTLIKPVIQKIRKLGFPSKMLQMEMVPDPHGKFTYPDEIKIKLFKHMYELFKPWKDDVFIYLCMEKSSIWKAVFGNVFENNDEFEKEFGRRTMEKANIQTK